MLKGITNVLTIIALVFVFFLFVFSMPIGEQGNQITAAYVTDDACEVFYTGQGRFYCEFGDKTCEMLLYEQCFGR